MTITKALSIRPRPLTPWELPSLLRPLYMHRGPRNIRASERTHFLAIRQFVQQHRFAVASQVRRRFPEYLRSDRTTRRHLAEMEALGYLGVVVTRGTSPLFPKVYYATDRGIHKLRGTLAHQGASPRDPSADRTPWGAYSAEHVLHEILLTEFLLVVWQTIRARPDLELLTIQRRSLPREPGFRVVIDERHTRLVPDALFVFRQRGSGPVCCFVELDTGTMGLKQIREKYRRYDAWARSAVGQDYVREAYRRYGAAEGPPNFRVLMIAADKAEGDDSQRMLDLMRAACEFPSSMRKRLWLTTVADLRAHQHDPQPLDAAIWRRASDIRTGVGDHRTPHARDSARALPGMRRFRSLVAEQLADARPHPLFPSSPSVMPVMPPTPRPRYMHVSG